MTSLPEMDPRPRGTPLPPVAALTDVLDDEAHPIRRFFDARLPNLASVDKRWRSAGPPALLPATRDNLDVVGMAFDYRARFALRTPIISKLAAAGAADLFGLDQAAQVQPAGAFSVLARELSQLFDLVGPDAGIPPGGPTERRLNECCYMLALFETCVRNAASSQTSPLAQLAQTDYAAVPCRLVPPEVPEDLARLVTAFWELHAAGWNAGNIVPNPVLGRGSIGADADLIVDKCLIEIKTSTARRCLNLARTVYQLVGYAALDINDRYQITDLAFYLGRVPALLQWPANQLIDELSNGKATLLSLRNELSELIDNVPAVRWRTTRTSRRRPTTLDPLSGGQTTVADNDNAEIAMRLCCDAAISWSETVGEGHLTRRDALTRFSIAHARLHRLVGSAIASHPEAFARQLARPLTDWLPPELCPPNVPSEALLASAVDGVLAASTAILRLEHRDHPGRPFETELVRARVAKALFGLTPEQYPAARRALIDKPSGTEMEILITLERTGIGRGTTLYEPIPSSVSASGKWWPCPLCAWPMSLSDNQAACAFEPHRRAGAIFYRTNNGELRSMARRTCKAPAGRPAAGAYRLLPAVWRFVTIPGLAELDLAARIRSRLPHAQIDLWPDMDRCDITIRTDRTYDIDVKDWSNPTQLVRHLAATARDRRFMAPIVAVPPHRRDDLEILRHQADRYALPTTFLTFPQVIRRLEQP